MVKAWTGFWNARGKTAFVVLDDFVPGSEAARRTGSVMELFRHEALFHLIVIRDSDNFPEPLSEDFPFDFHLCAVDFRKPDKVERKQLLREVAAGAALPSEDKRAIYRECGADLYCLFHSLLVHERSLEPGQSPAGALTASLSAETQTLLFLACAVSGFADRELIIGRLGDDEGVLAEENARYESLLTLGLIREDADGYIRCIPDMSVFSETDSFRPAAVDFGRFMFREFETGRPINPLSLFRYLAFWGPAGKGIAVLHVLLERMLDNRQLKDAGVLLSSLPVIESLESSKNREALDNIVEAARLRYILLSAGSHEVDSLLRDTAAALSFQPGGEYAGDFRLSQARMFYAAYRWEEAGGSSKEALFSFQKRGLHRGETLAHQELALSLLALGKVPAALEHFEIARRIGGQIGASWAVMRASALDVVGQFLYGNMSRSARDCEMLRAVAQEKGRRDVWMLLTLCRMRIAWELARYEEAAGLAAEGEDSAVFYGMAHEAGVFRVWKGRALLAGGSEEGRRILLDASGSREALAFLAEAEWLAGNAGGAGEHIQAARQLKRESSRIQGEAEDWSDGFFPMEGRLADASGPRDVLGEWIEAFARFVDESGVCEYTASEGWRYPRPFGYLYAFWAMLRSSGSLRDTEIRYMGQAFNELQLRASRFDDNQMKRAWLAENPWNRQIMEEAHLRKIV